MTMKKTKRQLRQRITLAVFLALIITSLLFSLLIYFFLRTGLLTPELFVADNRFELVLILTIILSTIVSSVVTWVIINRFIGPIYQLIDAIEAVGQGNREIQLEYDDQTIESVRQLYESFNQMVVDINANERMTSAFVSGLSHEIKTPLATITGYVQLLQSRDLTDDQKRQYIRHILAASHQISSLSSNLLTLSQLENNSVEFSRENFYLDEQIRQTLVQMQPQWEEKKLQVDLDLENVVYYGHEESLEIVWRNLISNAIKYNKVSGDLKLKLWEDANRVYVVVEDTGIGMNEEDQRRIFEKFYQADNSRLTSGSGLGMAIVKSILDNHAGHICYESELGIGTRAEVRLEKLSPKQSYTNKSKERK